MPAVSTPKRRFLIYAVTGLVFGVIDWFYLDSLAHFPWGSLGQSILVVPVIIALNYGIWLVPIIPVVIREARITEKIISPMLAGVLTWSCAIFSYYFFYAALLSLGRLPNLGHLNIFGQKDANFWPEFWQMFQRVITAQFLEWLIIAIIGGAVLGALAFHFFHKKSLIHEEQFQRTA